MAPKSKLAISPWSVALLGFGLGTFLGPRLQAAMASELKSLSNVLTWSKRRWQSTVGTLKDPAVDIPSNAPDNCPGVRSENAGRSQACAGCPNQDICASGAAKVEDPLLPEISRNLSEVKKKILVLSGKGGVGKSTVTAQLSWFLQEKGFAIGLLDIDICGPSIPIMTGSRGMDVHRSADGWSPVYVEPNFSVMSVGYMIENETDAVIWRGPKKNGLIRQFLSDVLWGAQDLLIVDTPPGTSDEHLSIVTYLLHTHIDGALIVTTPQEVALADVRKEINFCKTVGIKIIGLIENMKGADFDLTADTSPTELTPAQKTCSNMDVPYLGSIPSEKALAEACELGVSLNKLVNSTSPAQRAFDRLTNCLLDLLNLPAPFVA